MRTVWVKRVVSLTARLIFVCCLALQFETAAVRLHSSSLLGFVGHSIRINSYQTRKPYHAVAPMLRKELCKLHAFNPVKSFFNALVKVPSLLFGQKEQTSKDSSSSEDAFGYEIDQEKQWHREEQDELEHWHYWTSEQKRLRDEKEANQKLQWPEVVARCVTEPLRKERQQHAQHPSEQPAVAPTFTSASMESQRVDRQNVTHDVPMHPLPIEKQAAKMRTKSPGILSPQPWSADEETLLAELVQPHTVTPHPGMKHKNVHLTQPYIDWVSVSQALQRTTSQCKTKWRVLCDRRAKRGRFTAQEDALIKQRVGEWFGVPVNATTNTTLLEKSYLTGDTKFNSRARKGLWAALDRELKRKSGSVLKHWRGAQREYAKGVH